MLDAPPTSLHLNAERSGFGRFKSPKEVAVAKIELDRAARESLARAIVRHLKTELDLEIGAFEAGDLAGLLAERIGPIFYNQGLRDAQALLRARVETITEAIEELEKPVQDRG
jgi:uncharacterized protein (DUF2164 family)